MSSQILSEASGTERAPREGPGVSTASVYMLFSPSNIPLSASHTPLLCLLCSVPPAATDTFVFARVFSLWLLQINIFSVTLSFLMNVDDIDFPTTEAAVELRFQITGRDRLYIPREPKSIQLAVLRCLATEPSFFFSCPPVY